MISWFTRYTILRMHLNVVDFRVMRRLCHREWNWLWNWRCVNQHSWDPWQRTTWSRRVTSDFNIVLCNPNCLRIYMIVHAFCTRYFTSSNRCLTQKKKKNQTTDHFLFQSDSNNSLSNMASHIDSVLYYLQHNTNVTPWYTSMPKQWRPAATMLMNFTCIWVPKWGEIDNSWFQLSVFHLFAFYYPRVMFNPSLGLFWCGALQHKKKINLYS